jgi:hypothetical protein
MSLVVLAYIAVTVTIRYDWMRLTESNHVIDTASLPIRRVWFARGAVLIILTGFVSPIMFRMVFTTP